MRSFWVAVGVAVLVASIGYTILRERPGQASPARDGEMVLAAASGADASVGEPGEPTTELASLTTANEKSDVSAKSVFYQWVDERGSVSFAASLDEVPTAWRQRAGRVELDAGGFTNGKTSSPRAIPSRRPQRAPYVPPAPVHEVTVYTAPWCGWCRKTLAFLDERGVDYDNKDIELDEEYADELREKTGRTAIPLVEIDGTQIRGFDPGQMAALLD